MKYDLRLTHKLVLTDSDTYFTDRADGWGKKTNSRIIGSFELTIKY
jgi:hypothetical protein